MMSDQMSSSLDVNMEQILSVVFRYGGHQYGLWVGQLGDGRALILGEYVNK